MLTGIYKLLKSEGKRENANELPPQTHTPGDIISVVTRRLTGGKISSPSQP